jgi:membrane carboxypeptidase/penicillin-binding protein PbpC
VTGFVYNTLSDRELRRETFGNRAENLEISGKKVAVKTGTTDDYRDSWAIGYDSRYVVGVWVGNNDNSPMREVAGSVGGASVWKRIFEGL